MLVPPREPWPLMLGAAWLAGILPYLALMTAVLIAYPVSKAGPAAFAPAGDESEVAAVIAKFKQRDPGMAKVIAGACGGELQVRPPETRCPSLGGALTARASGDLAYRGQKFSFHPTKRAR